MKRNNNIAYAIKLLGIIMAVWGVIRAFIVQSQFSPMYYGDDMMGHMGMMTEFNVPIFFSIIATHLMYGLLIIGFGEIIDLLHKIHDRKE